jgi:7-cyano-7-deazaguanine synthase in queuosine biosynthesis
METFINYFALDQHKVWSQHYPYEIEMPFKNLTKTQIVQRYLDFNGSVEDLKKYSRSCYKGGTKECGICRSCIRKAIALKLNNIEYKDIFENDPKDGITKELIEKMKTRSGLEYAEFERFINE